MKKSLYILFAFMLLIIASANAQAYTKGTKILNLGIISDGVYVGFDYAIHPDITLGAVADVILYNHADDYSPFRLAVNGNYHFNSVFGIPEKFDLYAGLSAIINDGFYLNAQLGMRYYWSNFGVQFEFGGGGSFLGRGGISMKF